MEHNEQDEGGRKVLDVVHVVLQLHDSVLDRFAVFVIDLCPPGNTRLYRMAMSVKRDQARELADEFGTFGARTDDRHLPPDHIEQLWQLVQACLSEKT